MNQFSDLWFDDGQRIIIVVEHPMPRKINHPEGINAEKQQANSSAFTSY